MNKRRTVLCFACAVLLLSSVLCGCEIGPQSIESLMRPPRAAGEQELEKALNAAWGSGFSLSVPQSGQYHTAITLFDLNGDQTEEAVVFYSPDPDSVHLCVLQMNADTWEKVEDLTGDGNGVYSLDFADLNGDGFSEIYVGWSMYNDKTKKTLSVYSGSSADGRLAFTLCATEAYDHYLLADGNGSGVKQLFLAYADSAQAPIAAVIKRFSLSASGQIVPAGTLQMDPRVVRIESLLCDQPEGERHPRLFADAILADNRMITDVFLWSDDQNDYFCPFRQKDGERNTVTLRSGTVKSADVDRDGLIEIPLRRKFNQSKEDDPSMGYLLTWCSLQGQEPVEKVCFAVNVAENYRLLFPKEWNGKVFVQYTDAPLWSFVNQNGEPLFSIAVQKSDSPGSDNTTASVLDDTSAPGTTYSCQVTEKGRAFGINDEMLKENFEYDAGGNAK